VLRTLLRAICAAAILLPVAGAFPAAGDDGPSRTVDAADRPIRTKLVSNDPQELRTLTAVRPVAKSDKTAVIIVGGLGSIPSDGAFDPLIARLQADPQTVVIRFGADPQHPYDSSGPIEPSAQSLIAQVRELAARYGGGVNIVAHSMGGAVVDQALADGLSSADGVITYVSLASPHNGSTEALLGQAFLAGANALDAGPEFRELSAGLSHDLGGAAVRDLTRSRTAVPSNGIARLDLRLATDPVVTAPDASSRTGTSRVLLPSSLKDLEGHGGILVNAAALDQVVATIRGRSVVPDRRSELERRVADGVSTVVGWLAPLGYLGLLVGGLCGAVLLRSRRRREPLARLIKGVALSAHHVVARVARALVSVVRHLLHAAPRPGCA